jgi:hypothetical protein
LPPKKNGYTPFPNGFPNLQNVFPSLPRDFSARKNGRPAFVSRPDSGRACTPPAMLAPVEARARRNGIQSQQRPPSPKPSPDGEGSQDPRVIGKIHDWVYPDNHPQNQNRAIAIPSTGGERKGEGDRKLQILPTKNLAPCDRQTRPARSPITSGIHALAHVHQHLIEGVDPDEAYARKFKIKDDIDRERHDQRESGGVKPVAGVAVGHAVARQ